MKINFTPETFPNLLHIHELMVTAPLSAAWLKSPIVQMYAFKTSGKFGFCWLFPLVGSDTTESTQMWFCD